VLPQQGRSRNFGVRRTRSDRERAIPKADLLGNDARDVDQASRRVPAPLHIPQERLPASEQHGAVLNG
jgi:hypothetical protein